MSPTMQIRKLEPSEVGLYRQLRLTSLRTDPGAFHLTLTEAEKKPLDFFALEISDPNFGCLGAFAGDQLVGMVILKRQGDKANLYTLYVLPEFRNQGLGTSLVTEAISQAQSARMNSVELTVMEGNPAEAMYLAFGFEKSGKVPGPAQENILRKRLIVYN